MDYTNASILPEIRRHAKNCPDITLNYAITRAVRVFCRESHLYQKTINLPLISGLPVYQLDLPVDEVIYVKGVQYNDCALQSMRPEDVFFTKTGNYPTEYMYEPPDLLYLRPIPINVAGGGDPETQQELSNFPIPQNNQMDVYTNSSTNETPCICLVKLVLQPTETSQIVPAQIYHRYKEAIGAGALAWVLSMPEEVWTNLTLSATMNAVFEQGVSDAKRKRMFGNVSGAVRIQPRSFFNQ